MRSLSLIGLFSPALVFASSEGVNPSAQDLFHIGGLPISNSIFTTWLIAALIIIAIRMIFGSSGEQVLGHEPRLPVVLV